MTLGETPRYDKAKELEIVLDLYLDPDDMISEEFMESAVWHCPECRETSFVAKFGWGKAGCLREECKLPKSMSAMELIAYFEDLDPKTDKRSIYKKRKEILEEARREEELERQEEERRRREREEAKRRAEVQRRAELRRAEEAASRERDLRAQAEELYGPEELEEVIAEKREQQRKEAERVANRTAAELAGEDRGLSPGNCRAHHSGRDESHGGGAGAVAGGAGRRGVLLPLGSGKAVRLRRVRAL